MSIKTHAGRSTEEEREYQRLRVRTWRKANPEKANEITRKSLRKQYRVNPRKMRDHDRKWRYGMGPGQFDQIVRDQGGVCVVCKQKPATHVDHDHKTGKIRGILCNNCNYGLGLFGDDPERLASAAGYLIRHVREQIVGVLSRHVEAAA